MVDGVGAEAATGAEGAPVNGATGAEGVQGAGAAGWFSGFDPETQGYLANKSWNNDKGPAEVVKAYRNLERLQRSDQMPWPKDLNDKEGWDRVYSKMGRPSTWQEYGIVPAGPDGKPDEKADRGFADAMSQTFHELGLGKDAAQKLAAKYTEHSNRMMQAADQQFSQRSASELAAVRTEWGTDADAKFAAAQRFAVAYQLDAPVMQKIERAIGTKSMMDLFSRIGTGLSEDRGSGAGGGGGRFVTTEQAQAKLNDLKHDQGWVKRYLDGGQTERAEYEKLINIVAGG